MKVALLFFGQARFIDSPISYNSIKEHLLDKYDVDIFAHTWWTENEENFSASTNVRGEDMPVYSNTLELIKLQYNPKVFVHEPQKNFLQEPFVRKYIEGMMEHHRWTEQSWKWSPDHRNARNYFNMCSALYSAEKVTQLFKNYINQTNIQYDMIILGRYDLYIKNIPNLNELSPNKYYISNIHSNWPDEIFISTPKFLKAFEVYSFLKDKVENENNFIKSIDRCSTEYLREVCFYEYFNKNDVAPINIRTSILRGKFILNYGDKL